MTSELSAVAAHLDERIPRLLDEHDIPGVAIGLVQRDDAWLAGFGSTRRDGGTPVSESTAFSLQSISKTFTALTVLHAVGDGLLDLDDPVTRHLPDFSVRSRYEQRPQDLMTVRHLLSHKAGFTHEAPVGNNYIVGDKSFDEHVASIGGTWLRYPIGARYEYSNLGIDLAAQMVARLRGRDFTSCARDAVLVPLGMTGSTFDLAEIEAFADRAVGHDHDARYPLKIPMVAAGGMYSCVSDLVRFLQSVLGGRVLPAAQIEQMRTIPFPVPGQTGGYGLGLTVIRGDDWVVYGHSGGGFGFLTDLYWEPAAGAGVAVLTNSRNHPLQGLLALEILARLAGRDPDAPLGTGPVATEPAVAADYAAYCGEYVGRLAAIELVASDGRLCLRNAQGRSVPLRATAGDDVVAHLPGQPVPMALRLVVADDGTPSHLVALDDGSTLSYNGATVPASPRAAADAERDASGHAGAYELPALGPLRTQARVELDSGRLWLTLIDPTDTRRLRLDPHETIDGLYFSSTGETLDLRGEPPSYASLPLLRHRR